MREGAGRPGRGASWDGPEQVRAFLKDVRVESGKVSWPTRTELRESTIVVTASVLLVSFFVGVVDLVRQYVMRWRSARPLTRRAPSPPVVCRRAAPGNREGP